jgi:biopolymer transport protein TolQ
MMPISVQPAIFSTGALGPGFNSDIVHMILNAGLMVKFVMLVLFLFSVVSWAIIFMKWRQYRRARDDSELFMERFWEGTEFSRLLNESVELGESPSAQLFRAGFTEFRRVGSLNYPPPENGDALIHSALAQVERALKRTAIQQGNRLERFISFLATTGNTAPFIGLFGTVWGIMESFRGIGLRGSASLAVVAPGISEALIATAAGLVAAIPAVVAYNFFSRRVSVFLSEMDSFTSDFLSVIERQHLKRKNPSKEG